ncbi:MAG: aspartate aminotransferase family protein [Sphingobacteriales bacterium]|nr:MAG: aspartate aminotransferase family protein [Sphingobacteriales bacterium]TAF79738.1 MAG: aspartate aminotransferase family protein [Sphingobacteriales bacterium]
MSHIQLKTTLPGPKAQLVLERRKNALPAGLAKSTEVVVDKALGALVWDIDGNQLIDLAGGIGMINVGHCHPKVVAAVKAQADKYLHTCALVTTMEPYIDLAELLNSLTPGDFAKKTLLASSGSEAVENAINVSKYYTKRNAVLCFEGAYHGRTLLTLSLTSKYALFKKGMGSFVSDIYRIPAPNLYRKIAGMTDEEYINYFIKQLDIAFISQVDPESLAAIIIEPIMGEGGFIQMPKAYLQKIREVCDKYGIVMIADEIQCGAARTGKFFAIEHTGVIPDIVVSAKSIGAGMPISATTGRAEIMDAPHLGGVGGTYGGNPLACVAAIEAIHILKSEEFLTQVNHLGNIIQTTLEGWKQKYPIIGDVRGIGAMRLIEFVKDRNSKDPDPEITLEIIKDAVSKGLIMIRAGLFSNCLRLLPPVVITDEQIVEALGVLEGAIERACFKK